MFHDQLQNAYDQLTECVDCNMSTKKEIQSSFEQFEAIFTGTSYDNDADNVYWLQDVDFFNVSVFTNGLVGALCVRDDSDPSKNDLTDFVHDFGYKTYFEKPILQEAKYFFIVRYVGNQHYDLLHDSMRNTSLFSTKAINDPTSAISVLLRLLSTKRRMELSGRSPNITWDEIYGLANSNTEYCIPTSFFTLNVPSWETWYDNCISFEHDIFKEVKKIFPWARLNTNEMKAMQGLIRDDRHKNDNLSMPEIDQNYAIRLVQRNPNKFIKVILNVKEFEKEYDVRYVGYIYSEGNNYKEKFFDINGIEIMSDRFQKLTGVKGLNYCNDHFKSGDWRIVDVMDINKVQQKLAWMIFQARVHAAGKFDFMLRRKIGMDIGEDFDACIVEKFRLMAELTQNPAIKKRFIFAYIFGKYSDVVTKRMFLFLSDAMDKELTDEFKNRAIQNLQRKKKEQNILNFLLISTDDLLYEMKWLETTRAKKKFQFVLKLLLNLKKLIGTNDMKRHYFVYTSFLRKHDYDFTHHPLEHHDDWIKLVGLFCKEKMFDNWIKNNKSMSTIDRYSLQNLSIVMRDHCGYGIEEHLRDLNKLLTEWKKDLEKNKPKKDYWKFDDFYDENTLKTMSFHHKNEKNLRAMLLRYETANDTLPQNKKVREKSDKSNDIATISNDSIIQERKEKGKSNTVIIDKTKGIDRKAKEKTRSNHNLIKSKMSETSMVGNSNSISSKDVLYNEQKKNKDDKETNEETKLKSKVSSNMGQLDLLSIGESQKVSDYNPHQGGIEKKK